MQDVYSLFISLLFIVVEPIMLYTKAGKQVKKNDSVNKPYHYTSGKFECLDVMRDVFGDERVKTWCVLNAFKYLYRCYKKNGEEDIEKANFYLNYVIKNFKEIN